VKIMTDLAPGFRPNRGSCPDEARGKRVIVQLRNGRIAGEKPVRDDLPPGWAADGKNGCRWSLRDNPFDIVGWRLVG